MPAKDDFTIDLSEGFRNKPSNETDKNEEHPHLLSEEEFINLPSVNVGQIRNLLSPGVVVYVRPSNAITYWHGEACDIPLEMFPMVVNTIGLPKRDEPIPGIYGAVSLFVDKCDKYEISAKKEDYRTLTAPHKTRGVPPPYSRDEKDDSGLFNDYE